MKNPFSLEDKTVLVTGASSGIGRAVAVECSRLGARIVATGRDESRLDETLRALHGQRHLSIAGDLCDERFVASLAMQCPALDGVVHSAGVAMYVPVKFITGEKVEEIFDINFRAPVLLTRELLKARRIERGGSVVFISSTSGVMTSAIGNSLYSASKGAVSGFAKGLALELSERGMRANTVMPAMIHTEMTDELLSQEQIDQDMKNYPLGRYGRAEEVAWAVAYLLSDAAAWVTGTNLLIDGGLTLK